MTGRKWSLLKRHCPLCRAPRWIITDPDGMQRGCYGMRQIAAVVLTGMFRPAA